MVRITINNDLKKKLLAADGMVELCDESGKLLAHAIPNQSQIPPGWVPMTPELSDEELARRMEYDGPGMTTEELIDHLRKKP